MVIMTEKKNALNKPKATHTITKGDVEALIYTRQTNSGFNFYDFQLQRKYRSGTGKEGHGASFFAKNAQDILDAVSAATEWIKAKDQSDAML
jgi:hypothetical protein